MKLTGLFCGLGVLVAWTGGAAGAGLADVSLERLEQTPPVSPESFDFVVIGDTRSGEPLTQPPAFRQAIREFNILGPAFVVDVGDLILGGAAKGVPPQWDVFDEAVSACGPPFLPVTGNHDVSNAATATLWQERMGPLRYSFRYGNSLFVALDSEEVGAIGRISDEQVAWLEKELEASNAEHIFVFLHQPYFAMADDPKTGVTGWEKHWSNVAEVLRGHPVRIVFGAHWHIYRDCGVRDGVRYVITGGGGASYGKLPEEEGGFFHYLLVRVRGDDVRWSVVKTGSILPENVVTSERIQEVRNVRRTWVRCEELAAPYGEGFDRDVAITVANPHETPLQSTLAWDVPDGWSVSPVEMDYSVAPNGVQPLVFRVKADSPADVRFPVPAYRTRYENTQFGDPVDLSMRMDLVPTTEAARATGPVRADGVLDEWGRTVPVPLTYPFDYDIDDIEDLSSQVRFMWDDSHFYLAVETTDDVHHQPYAGDIVWSADNVELFLDRWSWGLTLTKDGPEVFLYWGVDVESETVNTDVELGVKVEGTRAVYEAAFPKAMVKPFELKAGSSTRFSLIMNDIEPGKKRHWAELTPGAGSGEGGFPRVKVVLAK